jgi:aspartate-semialdehyde dehydrogenase
LDVSLEDLNAELRSISGISIDSAAPGPSPVGVMGTDTIHIGRVQKDSGDGRSCALWVVADNLRIAASNAIQTAEQIMLAPALEA